MRLLSWPLGGLMLIGMTAFAADPDPKLKKEPKVDVPPTAVDVVKTTEKIVQDANEAGKRLGDRNAGADTQRIQKDILKNIDELIRQAQEPPPMKKDDQTPPPKKDNMGSDASPMPKSSMGGSKNDQSAARKERQERRNRTESTKQTEQRPLPSFLKPEPQSASGPNDPSNKMDKTGTKPRVPDIYKDVWGHLPEKMRQEMDLYFREQFMPRYGELLRNYYSSLAERAGKSSP